MPWPKRLLNSGRSTIRSMGEGDLDVVIVSCAEAKTEADVVSLEDFCYNQFQFKALRWKGRVMEPVSSRRSVRSRPCCFRLRFGARQLRYHRLG